MAIGKEMKEFMLRGNVVDMAVGVIIGGAFGKIVSSLVSDVVMPPLGALIGGVNFSSLSFVIHAATESNPAVTINYGIFLQTVLDFLIIASVIFFAIKGINALKSEVEELGDELFDDEEEEILKEEVPAPTKEELLLTEIRDLLKERK